MNNEKSQENVAVFRKLNIVAGVGELKGIKCPDCEGTIYLYCTEINKKRGRIEVCVGSKPYKNSLGVISYHVSDGCGFTRKIIAVIF